MKRGIRLLCLITAAALLGGCGGRTKEVRKPDDVTPEGFTFDENMQAAYYNSRVYVISGNSLYQMKPDGSDVSRTALDGTQSGVPVAIAVDEKGAVYLLQTLAEKTARTDGPTVAERIYHQARWNGSENGSTQASYEGYTEAVEMDPNGPQSPADEYRDPGGPKSPAEDDGSYVQPAGDPNYGPWTDPNLRQQQPSSDYGPWNDESLTGSTQEGTGPAGDPSLRGDDSGADKTTIVPAESSSKPAAAGGNASSGPSGSGTANSSSGTGSGNAGTGSSGMGSSGAGSGNAGTGSSGVEEENAGTGNSRANSAGSGDTGKENASDGDSGAGKEQSSGEDSTTGATAGTESKEIPEGALFVLKYDTQGKLVWQMPVPGNANRVTYDKKDEVILITGGNASYTCRPSGGGMKELEKQPDDEMEKSPYLTVEERDVIGENAKVRVLADMGKDGMLLFADYGDGAKALLRLLRDS